MKLEFLSVHTSQNIHDYQAAAGRSLALFYRSTNLGPGDVTRDAFEQGDLYHVPPRQALDLYDLICKGTVPEKIISQLRLKKRPLHEVEAEFEQDVRQQLREAETAQRVRTSGNYGEPRYVLGSGWMRGSYPMVRGDLDRAHRRELDSADRFHNLMREDSGEDMENVWK